MESNVVLALLGALVGTAFILGVVLRATQTRIRRAPANGKVKVLRTAEMADLAEAANVTGDRAADQDSLEEVEAFGSLLTLVQFSTETCARCPATARNLRTAASAHDGVTHLEIDVTRRDDLIQRYSILRTPTVLVIDGEQRIRARISGPISPSQASEIITGQLPRVPETEGSFV